jgi:hypothetical protein
MSSKDASVDPNLISCGIDANILLYPVDEDSPLTRFRRVNWLNPVAPI